MRNSYAGLIMFLSICCTCHCSESSVTVLFEAEDWVVSNCWKAESIDGASNGEVISYVAPKQDQFGLRIATEKLPKKTITISTPGKYWIWVRYYKEAEKLRGTGVLLRDENLEEVAYHMLHLVPKQQRCRPYEDFSAPYLDKKGFIWERFPVTFERCMKMFFDLSQYINGYVKVGRGGGAGLDCFILTDDREFSPTEMDLSGIQKDKLPGPKNTRSNPEGYFLSKGFPCHTSFFSGIEDNKEHMHLALTSCGNLFIDYARHVQQGFNSDEGWGPVNSPHYARTHGVTGEVLLGCFWGLADKTYKHPEGRFVNSKGDISGHFSYSFEPVRTGLGIKKQLERLIPGYHDNPGVGFWRICWENAGRFDYSKYAVHEFRKWLNETHKVTTQVLARNGRAPEGIGPSQLHQHRA